MRHPRPGILEYKRVLQLLRLASEIEQRCIYFIADDLGRVHANG